MVQPCEGDILVAIRAVPQEGLLNPLGGHAEDVAPAVVVPRFGDGSARIHQRPHMTRTVYHIVAGVGRVLQVDSGNQVLCSHGSASLCIAKHQKHSHNHRNNVE